MSFFLERKYLLLISSRLEGFKAKSGNVWNCRCFLCGDSQKSKTKKRGYFYEKAGRMKYTCQNCGQNRSFFAILKELDPFLYKEFLVERFQDEDRPKNRPTEVAKPTPLFEAPTIALPSIADLIPEHYARRYVAGRLIPTEFYTRLHFTEDFAKFASSVVEDPGTTKDLRPHEARLVIPFYDQQRRLTMIQGRAFGDTSLRYITLKVDRNAQKVYGLDRFDIRRPGFVVEGPIDSMFLPNCLASADGDLSSVANLVDREKTTFVFDNEPRNAEIVGNMMKCIDKGLRIAIWPSTMKAKDINAMVLDGWTPDSLLELLNKNTFVGVTANFKLNQWKKT